MFHFPAMFDDTGGSLNRPTQRQQLHLHPPGRRSVRRRFNTGRGGAWDGGDACSDGCLSMVLLIHVTVINSFYLFFLSMIAI